MLGTTPETNLATRAYLSGFEVIPLDEVIAEGPSSCAADIG